MKNIIFKDVYKGYPTKKHGWKEVLKGVTFEVTPGKSLGILGRNGAGKSTLIRLISGSEQQDHGEIDTQGAEISWPLGGAFGLSTNLSGRENLEFVCRIYNKNIPESIERLNKFAELNEYIDLPVMSYSAGMRARLAFGIAMSIDFDTYLIDEGFSAGDARFRKRGEELFKEKKQNSNIIIVSHNVTTIKKMSDYVGILNKGELQLYDNVDEAIEIYQNL